MHLSALSSFFPKCSKLLHAANNLWHHRLGNQTSSTYIPILRVSVALTAAGHKLAGPVLINLPTELWDSWGVSEFPFTRPMARPARSVGGAEGPL